MTFDGIPAASGNAPHTAALAPSAAQARTLRSRNLGVLVLLSVIAVAAVAVAVLAFVRPNAEPWQGWLLLAAGILFALFVVLRARRVVAASREVTKPPYVTLGPAGIRTRDGIEFAWTELSRVIVVQRAKREVGPAGPGASRVGRRIGVAAYNAEGVQGRVEIEVRDAELLRSRLGAAGPVAGKVKGKKLVLPFWVVAEDTYPAFSHVLNELGRQHGVGIVERSEAY